MVIKNFIQAWLILAKNNLQAQLLTRSNASLFVVGKLLNFAFSIILVFSVFKTTNLVQGYTLDQVIIFTMVFNLTDSLSGFLFRAIYMFRPILVKGDFDLDLVKPLPTFFRPIFSAPDFLDLPPILIQTIVFLIFLFRSSIQISASNVLIFLILLLCGLFITFSLYLIVAAISILVTEVDNLMSIIRSVSRAGIVPTDIYHGFFKFVLDYIIPVTFITTVPAKSLIGLANPQLILLISLVSILSLVISLSVWKLSLRFYTSASS